MGLRFYSSFMKSTSKEKHFTIRKALVHEALENGIKPTARRFDMSKNTVRTWVRRFQEEGNDGLLDRRAGPNHIPHKTSQTIEQQIVEIRKTALLKWLFSAFLVVPENSTPLSVCTVTRPGN